MLFWSTAFWIQVSCHSCYGLHLPDLPWYRDICPACSTTHALHSVLLWAMLSCLSCYGYPSPIDCVVASVNYKGFIIYCYTLGNWNHANGYEHCNKMGACQHEDKPFCLSNVLRDATEVITCLESVHAHVLKWTLYFSFYFAPRDKGYSLWTRKKQRMQ
jgi:hypothetical protein